MSMQSTVYHDPLFRMLLEREGKCNSLEVRREGRVVASMRYTTYRKHVFFLFANDSLSHVGGPCLCEGLTPEVRAEVLVELISQIPRHASAVFPLPPGTSVDVVDAFRNAGFELEYEPTFRHHPGDGPFKTKGQVETNIKDANTRVFINKNAISPKEFIDFYSDILKRDGLRSHCSLATALNVIETSWSGDSVAKSQNVGGDYQVTLFSAHERIKGDDGEQPGRLIAVVAILHAKIGRAPSSSVLPEAYYWLTKCDRNAARDYPHTVEAIIRRISEWAMENELILDLDGASDTGKMRFYRKLGFARQVDRIIVVRNTPMYEFIMRYWGDISTLIRRRSFCGILGFLYTHKRELSRCALSSVVNRLRSCFSRAKWTSRGAVPGVGRGNGFMFSSLQ